MPLSQPRPRPRLCRCMRSSLSGIYARHKASGVCLRLSRRRVSHAMVKHSFVSRVPGISLPSGMFPNELLGSLCSSGGSSSQGVGLGLGPFRWLRPEGISACTSILNATPSPRTGPWTLLLCLSGEEKFLRNPPW